MARFYPRHFLLKNMHTKFRYLDEDFFTEIQDRAFCSAF